MYLSGIFALDLHFKYKILSPFLKKKKKKDNRNEKLNIAEKFVDDIWIITHRTPRIFSNRVKVSKFPREDLQFRRSIIIQKKNTAFQNFLQKKNEISLADINKEIRREGGGS